MHILVAFVFILSCAAFPTNYPESSDDFPQLDEGDLENLVPQASAAVNLGSLILARNAGFTTDLEDTDLPQGPESPRNSRSPQHWYNPQSTGHYYKPQQTQHYEAHHYKPQHHGESHHHSYQHYKPAHLYKPSYHYKPAQQYKPDGHYN